MPRLLFPLVEPGVYLSLKATIQRESSLNGRLPFYVFLMLLAVQRTSVQDNH